MIDQRRHQPVYSPLSLRLRVQWRVGLLLAALLVGVGVARAALVATCAGGALNGDLFPACTSPGYTDHLEIAAETLVLWCPDGAYTYVDDCGVMPVWMRADSVAGGDLLYNESSEVFAPVGLIAAEWPAYAAGGGSGGGGEGGGDISEADLTEAGSWFAAAFVLVVMLWGMGKGIGLIVSVVRGR